MSADTPGRREVAHRLFAAEFDDATLSYSENDEERAPNYVITPTGLRANRLFVAGVLTSVESVNEEVVRARVVDPSGAFVVYAGQYQPDELAFLERADPPAFVAITGKARTFQPEDSDRIFTSVRPESTNEVDADTRDRAVVTAAEATLRRVAVAAAAIDTGLTGDDLEAELRRRGVDPSLAAGIPLAFDHYGTTTAYLEAVRRLAVDALEVVAEERQEVRALDLAPDEGGTATLGPLPSDDELPNLAGIDDGRAVGGRSGEVTGHDVTTPAADGEATTTATATDGDAPEMDSQSPSTAGSTTSAETTAESPSATPDDAASTPPTDDAVESTTETDAADDVDGDRRRETAPTDASESAIDAREDDPAGGDVGSLDNLDDEGDLGDFDDGAALDDFDGGSGGETDEDDLYELDEEERRAVEEEYGTEFETGTEVDPAGEADVDVPTRPGDGSHESADSEPAEPDAGDDSESDVAGAASAIEDGETGGAATEEQAADEGGAEERDDGDATDVDLEEAVVALMADLDDGDGAPREDVVAAATDDHGATPDEVEEAIQAALMDGRCYEPAEDRLKAI